jgi:TonB family protein
MEMAGTTENLMRALAMILGTVLAAHGANTPEKLIPKMEWGDPSGENPPERPHLLNPEEAQATLRKLYPEKAREAGREGEVQVSIKIRADGTVESAKVLQSSGQEFNAPALKVARMMKFSSYKQQEKPAPSRIVRKIIFRLDNQKNGMLPSN